MATSRKKETNHSESSPSYLSPWRRRRSNAHDAATRSLLEEASSDRGRVVFSASFRRLMQKTQVFALEESGARTRLTHSLEVAHVGMYIVEKVFDLLDEKVSSTNLAAWQKLEREERLAIRSFVEVACLVHDIGNPPFGHFGEKAINNWFNNQTGEAWLKPIHAHPGILHDFVSFDGNKQGFRILTRLQRDLNDRFGLNLTGTQLASTVKYPKQDEKKPNKCSYFYSEREIKAQIWKELQLKEDERHPCSLLMEAADDIAYCISDLEDAAEKGLVTIDDLKAAFDDLTLNFQDRPKDFTTARTKLTVSCVSKAAEKFVELLIQGKLTTGGPIFKDKEPRLERLRDITAKKVYSSRLVLTNEITGFQVIQGLLNYFLPLLKMDETAFRRLASAFEKGESVYQDSLEDVLKKSTQEPSLLSLLPRKHLAVYREAVESATKENDYPEIFHRTHLILDFIVGMTDDFALRTYRILSGHTTHGKA